MSFLDLIRKRYSVRAFDPRPIEREKLLAVLDAARLAPSACNFQPWRFLVLRDPTNRAALAECYPRDWFRAAPAVIVCCLETARAWRRADGKVHGDIDVAIAVDHLTLAAAEAGLGTCWVCAFDAVKASKILSLPDGIEPIALIPIGYPASTGTPADRHIQRKPLEEVVHWESFPG
jgi:nitroreductase